MSQKKYVRCDNAMVVSETNKAVKLSLSYADGSSHMVRWLPKSHLHPDSISGTGDEGPAIFTDWIANQEGLPWNDVHETVG